MTQVQQDRIFSHFPNVAFNLVAIAASTGGLKAICQILSTIPSDFPSAIVIVQHLSGRHRSYMAEILSKCTTLRVKQAEQGEIVCAGTVYTCVPDKHLLVNLGGIVCLSDEPKVKFSRPAGDKLFTSVALSYKTRAVAVVLTGKDGDGSLGVLDIKKYGGIVIAQDEATSECFSMPSAAIDTGKVDMVLPLDMISEQLVNLVMRPYAA
ncbi:chemotaxis protein CheB [Calothrix sp. HK-06]|nr:chemotaxis protein CheB [Calothrix sp. HK-06]